MAHHYYYLASNLAKPIYGFDDLFSLLHRLYIFNQYAAHMYMLQE